MKEIKSILNLFNSFKNEKNKAAIAQVVRVEESSYRREGARMLIFENGTFVGGISGGCLEGDTLKRSKIAILKEEASLITYDTSSDDENQIGVGLGCNGVIDVLIQPIEKNNHVIDLLQRIVHYRKSHILVTIISQNDPNLPLGSTFYYDIDSHKLENCYNSNLKNVLLGEIQTVLEKRKSKLAHFELEKVTISAFVEFIPAPFHLAIYGDNYDVYPLLDFAKILDWELSIVGNIQKMNKEKLIGIQNTFQKEHDPQPDFDDRTAAILMAHDFETDIKNLKILLQTPVQYIGLLGPRKRYNKILTRLKEENIILTDFDNQRIHAPAGLEIGANSPEEIAASICSEIMSVFSNKEGGKLRTKKGPIHDRD